MLKNAKSFLVFSLVGATGAGIYFLILAVLLEILAIDYRAAVTIAYLLGMIFHFLTNKLLTFKNRELAATTTQLFRYATVAALVLVPAGRDSGGFFVPSGAILRYVPEQPNYWPKANAYGGR